MAKRKRHRLLGCLPRLIGGRCHVDAPASCRAPTCGCGPSKAALLEARAGIEPAYTALQAAA